MLLRGRRGGRRHHELGEIEQRPGMRRADRFRRAEAAPGAPLQARRRRERLLAGGAIDRDELIELGVRDRDGRHHLGVGLDRLRLQDRQDDVLDAGEKFGKRVARGRGVEQELRVDDVLVAVRIKREDAHAGAEFEIDDVDGAADADDQVGSAEGAGDGRKVDALLEIELGPGRVEERIHVGITRPQRVLDVVERDRVAVDRLADEALEGARFSSIRSAIAAWSAVPRSA